MLGTLLVLLLAGAPDLEALLARPVSPGSLALLVEHHGDPRALRRIRDGLVHAQPSVRAASGRVGRVVGDRAWVEPLVAALNTETDPSVASELLTSLLVLDPQQEVAAMTAVQRLACGLADRAAYGLGAPSGEPSRARFAALLKGGAGAASLQSWLRRGIEGDASFLARVATEALRARSAGGWRALLGAARERAPLDPELMVRALEKPDDVRHATLFDLAVRAATGQPVSPRVAAALAALRTERAEPEPGLRLRLALVDAAAGASVDQLPDVLAASGEAGKPIVVGLLREPKVTAAFRKDVREALHRYVDLPQTGAPADVPTDAVRRRTLLMTGYPAGFVADTLAVAGCALRERRVLGSRMVLDAQARPTTIEVFTDQDSGPECKAAARALALSRVGDPTVNGPVEETLLLPLEREVLDCMNSSTCLNGRRNVEGAAPVLGAAIREPRKTRSEAPRYPAGAKASMVQGTVVLETEITAEGCVRAVEIKSTPHVLLNYEALRAVSLWRYSPALVAGVPTPVSMTVTVNFRLN